VTVTVPVGPDSGAGDAGDGSLEIEFQLPPDFVDILQPADDAEARVVHDQLFARMFPRADDDDRGYLVDGLMMWRARMIEAGFVMHGIVAVPAGADTPVPVHWHILSGLIDAPTSDEVDVGTLAEKFLGAELGPDAYVESFPSDMGWGVGMITTAALPDLELPMPRTDVEMPPTVGLAAAVVGAHGQRKALLVLGLSFDTAQAVEVGALVALISAHAIVRPVGTAAPDVAT
jgi:hypothetical protein